MYSLIRLINISKITGKIISTLQAEIIIFISILSPPSGVLTYIPFLIGFLVFRKTSDIVVSLFFRNKYKKPSICNNKNKILS